MNKISIVFLDIDGTLTDGKIHYSLMGDEIKSFNIKDGLIIATMVKMQYKFVVVTGRKSIIVDKRMKELGVKEVYQNIKNKEGFINDYLDRNKINKSICAYLGDDLNDLKVMRRMSFKGCPRNACQQIKEIADFISSYDGGEGAVREILECLLKENNDYDRFIELYTM